MSSMLEHSQGTSQLVHEKSKSWKPLVQLGLILMFLFAGTFLGDWIDGGKQIGGTIGWATLVISSIMCIVIVYREGESLETIGLARPKSWLRTIGWGFLLMICTYLLVVLFAILVLQPLVDSQQDNSRFEQLDRTLWTYVFGFIAIWTGAAFAEEVIMRGFFLNRITKIWGDRPLVNYFAILIGGLIFGLMHSYQGITGILLTGYVGIIMGLAYYWLGRNLWIVILAHGLIDTISIAIILSQSQPTTGN